MMAALELRHSPAAGAVEHPWHLMCGVAGLHFFKHGSAQARQLVHMLVAVDKIWRRAHGLLKGIQLVAPCGTHLHG